MVKSELMDAHIPMMFCKDDLKLRQFVLSLFLYLLARI